MNYSVGDIVETKKNHPCGSNTWEITRIGVDFKLRCIGCNHILIIPREKAIKMIKRIVSKNSDKAE